MRIVVPLLLVLALLAPSAASAERTEVTNLVAVHTVATGAILVWQPTPGARSYDVFRIVADAEPEHIGSTPLTLFADHEAPVDAFYVVVASEAPPSPVPTPSPQGGACVTASATGASVTARNCMPNNIWAWLEA